MEPCIWASMLLEIRSIIRRWTRNRWAMRNRRVSRNRVRIRVWTPRTVPAAKLSRRALCLELMVTKYSGVMMMPRGMVVKTTEGSSSASSSSFSTW